MAEAVFACDLSALTPEERGRREILAAGLLGTAFREEVEDGYCWSLPPEDEALRDLAEFISLERRCCPFLRFQLDFQPGEHLTLAIRGAPGVKDFLRAELGLA